jgi:hypothetical protein
MMLVRTDTLAGLNKNSVQYIYKPTICKKKYREETFMDTGTDKKKTTTSSITLQKLSKIW